MIETGLTLRGVVQDTAGQGRSGVRVELGSMDQPDRIRWYQRTDSEGRLEFDGLPTDALWIASFCTRDDARPVLHRRTRIEQIFAGRSDLIIEFSNVSEFASYVTWRVNDERDLTSADTTMRIRYVDAAGEVGGSQRVEARPDGVYRAGPLHAGRYRVESTGDFVSWQVTQPFDVAANATVDIGVVTIAEPDRVEFLVRDEEGAGEVYELVLKRVDRNAHTAAVRVVAGEASLVRVPPGTWAIACEGVTFDPERIVVHGGQWQHVDLRIK